MSTKMKFTALEASDIAQGVNGTRIEALYDTYVEAVRRAGRMGVTTPMARDAYLGAERYIDGLRTALAGLGFTAAMLNVDADV